jgi:hypothetical protein
MTTLHVTLKNWCSGKDFVLSMWRWKDQILTFVNYLPLFKLVGLHG